MITLKIPRIDAEHRLHVESSLVGEWYENVRFASVGLLGAWVGYCLLIVTDMGIERFEILMATQWTIAILTLIFLFYGYRFIGSDRNRLACGELAVALTLLSAGIGFYKQLPLMRDPGLQTIAFGICIGVLGAGAFAFAPSKRSFLICALCWAGPLQYYLVFESEKNSYKLMGVTQVIYVAVLYLIGRIDYIRRVQSILRELNLQQSNQTILKLKNQQDGDYYLTSLLLQPLLRNKSRKNAAITIELLHHQFKQFEFRRKQNELGGDVSSAHTLTLKGAECSVFINADAMGKSMQGAGGALVLGAVFESIVERTKVVSEYYNMYPERWLKSAFIELHKIFESLEGTMLVSAILGVIDHEAGMLYFINAEHPHAVLYRNAEATFIPTPHVFRKLGTPAAAQDIMISTFKLEAGDVIFLGSDGRDDIYIKMPDGTMSVNSDETLFLRHIERAKGEIGACFAEISAAGELKDDVSLMRIGFSGITQSSPESPALKKTLQLARAVNRFIHEGNISAAKDLLNEIADLQVRDNKMLRVLIRLAFKVRHYSLAVKWSEEFLKFCDDIGIIYLASVAHKRVENYSLSADLFERMRLRGVRDSKINSHLSEVYEKLGKRELTRKLQAGKEQ
ncbi:PP2C family protein-serine/threonine phosphatase [Turneriella parva]|uniref:Stage II sporulation protein E n=1 Tax=Turneriella parva (strain ATCC BAA-1111 / DSM 21527 / NCTC 11395 / H) TaxID=869212 RepID=I4B391_TURPD|nr:PP2C family protein-serine/threonine phosphatase [Turneriella parva]AFM11748.1 Stage II sporulation protein E [Turneriella parva DSM 21527]